MINRTRNRVRFLVERLLVRGAHFRLLFIAGVIGLVSAAAGLLGLAAGAGFGGPGEAVWWAFLRLTDPGYLGDDHGLWRRAIATALTVLGYVLFMGSLVAIMTQWLTQKLRVLERGLTPITVNGHILVLGWTNRTPVIVHELLLAQGRVRRFLRRRGLRRLVVVVLAEDVDAAMVQELRDELGPLWDSRRIVFRSGSPLEVDHLLRADYTHAAAVVVPGADFVSGGAQAMDNRTVKTLLSLGRDQSGEDALLPLVVSELFDTRKIHLARKAYGGPVEILASDAVICRLLAQTVRHPGISHVFNEFTVHGEGSELYVRHFPSLAGRRFYDLFPAFPRAIPLGLVRPSGGSFSPLLNPPAETVLSAEDQLVLLADSYESSEALVEFEPQSLSVGTLKSPVADPVRRRILVLGWSHRLAVLLQEFTLYRNERFEVDLLSSLATADRLRYLRDYDLPETDSLQLRHLEGDFTLPSVMGRIQPETYDHIVFLGSDRVDSDEEADARTLTGILLLREHLDVGDGTPHLLAELMNPDNARLLPSAQAEILPGPRLVSHMLAQVALRRELRAVYDELFGPGGAEIYLRPTAYYALEEAGETDFAEVRRKVAAMGDIALGVRRHGIGGKEAFRLNPASGEVFLLEQGYDLIVLSTDGA